MFDPGRSVWGGCLVQVGRGGAAGWDQFEANAKYGYKSTYSEDLYTTKLDKSKMSADQLKHAQRMASEIEGRGGVQ